ncbi:Cupredoxin, partial [Mycena amicta]
VTVGVEGSFFNPPTVSANLGDTILFVFGGDFHSVSQGSFDTPCQRLDGGFDSGFRGRGPNFADPTPIWSITITNASEPIWFFCMAGIPTSHCESGMVGYVDVDVSLH